MPRMPAKVWLPSLPGGGKTNFTEKQKLPEKGNPSIYDSTRERSTPHALMDEKRIHDSCILCVAEAEGAKVEPRKCLTADID